MQYDILTEIIQTDSVELLEKFLSDPTLSAEEVLKAEAGDTGNTALHYAVEKENLSCCMKIIDKSRVILGYRNEDGETPIHLMVKNKSLDICKTCISLASQDCLNIPDRKGLTALHIAAAGNSRQILTCLLDSGADAWRTVAENHFTPLHFAANTGSSECVKCLLSHIKDETKKIEYSNLKTKNGETALIIAAKHGAHGCCTELVGGANSSRCAAVVDVVDNTGLSALHFAAEHGSLSVLKYLVEAKAKKPENLMEIVIKKNFVECLQFLLQEPELKKIRNNKIPSQQNDTLLHLSIRAGNYQITQLLLDHGCKNTIRNDNEEYPFHLVAQQPCLNSRYLEEERLKVCNNVLKGTHRHIAKATK